MMNTSNVIDMSDGSSSMSSESQSYQFVDKTQSSASHLNKESVFVNEYKGKRLIDKTIDQSKVSINEDPREF